MGRLKFCSVPVSSPSLWSAWIGQNWRDVVSFLCRFHCQVWQSSKSRDVFSNMLLDKHLPGGTPFDNCEVRVAAYAHVERGASSGSVIRWSHEPHGARDEGSLCQKQVECFGLAACVQGDHRAFEIQDICCPAGLSCLSCVEKYGLKLWRSPTALETADAIDVFMDACCRQILTFHSGDWADFLLCWRRAV